MSEAMTDLHERRTQIHERLRTALDELDELDELEDDDDAYFGEYERRLQQAKARFDGMERDMNDDELVQALMDLDVLYFRVDVIKQSLPDGCEHVHQQLDTLCADLTNGLANMRPLIVRAGASAAGHHVPSLVEGLLARIDAQAMRAAKEGVKP